jgi:hypothetical protein
VSTIDERQGQTTKFVISQHSRFFLFSSSSPLETWTPSNPSGEEDGADSARIFNITTMTLSKLSGQVAPARPALSRTSSVFTNFPAAPVTAPPAREDGTEHTDAVLELIDGSAFRGISFGAEGKSVSGECVFQTGKLIAG